MSRKSYRLREPEDGERPAGRRPRRAPRRRAAAEPREAPGREEVAEPRGRTPGQRELLEALGREDGVLACGPAGSGKTYLAAAFGAALVARGGRRRMVVCRPTTDAGEGLGFLPGTLGEKLEPWMAPVYDAVDRTVGRRRRRAWQEAGVLEVCSFQHMQGRTWEDAFVLLDEAQNADNMQMETFLTRVGVGSSYAAVGDPVAQRVGGGRPGGFARALALAARRGLPVALVRLGYADVQRHPHARMWAEAFLDDHRPRGPRDKKD